MDLRTIKSGRRISRNGAANSRPQLWTFLSYVGFVLSVLCAELTPTEIADPDRKISTLYDMLDEQDATNRDAKGLPFTVCIHTAVFVIHAYP